jgi:hypothetical protein
MLETTNVLTIETTFMFLCLNRLLSICNIRTIFLLTCRPGQTYHKQDPPLILHGDAELRLQRKSVERSLESLVAQL